MEEWRYEDGCLLGCSAVFSGRSFPTFQRPLLPPSAIALMMEEARSSETLVNFYQTTRCYNPEDSHLSMDVLAKREIRAHARNRNPVVQPVE
jgi:hypothetical protein